MASSSFLRNASFYSSASFITVIASLISFPILTRMFEVGEYGMLGLITGTIPLLVAVGKIGMQHASIRFYSDVSHGGTPWTMVQYYSSLYLTLMLSAGTLFLIWNIFVMTVGEEIFDDLTLCILFVISSYIVLVRILESAMLNVLQAQEQAAKHTIFKVCKKLLVLVATLGTLFFYKAELIPYFQALAIAEAVLLVGFALYFVPFKKIKLSGYKKSLVASMMAFGIPMFGMEFGGALMNVADRYIINAYLSKEQLGAYSSAYTLVDYAQGIVTTALIASAIPMFLRLNAKEGLDNAQRFLTGALRVYIWAAMPVIFIVAAAGQSILTFLAGEDYASGAPVMPWIAAAIGLFGVFELVAAGLYLSKNTGKMFYIIVATAVANIALNLYAIPRYGLMGAAVTTLVCYFVAIVASYLWGRRYLHIQIPWLSLAKAALAGSLMYAFLNLWSPEMPLLDVLYKGSVGLMIYALLIVLLDSDARFELGKLRPAKA